MLLDRKAPLAVAKGVFYLTYLSRVGNISLWK